MEANDSEANVYPKLDSHSDFFGGEEVVVENDEIDEERIDEEEDLVLEATSEGSRKEEVTEAKKGKFLH